MLPPLARRMLGAAASAAAVLSLCACVPQGLAFRVDERLSFQAPQDRSTVRVPVRVAWEIEDFTVVPPGSGRAAQARDDAGYFGVFVDQSPVPPGELLSWVARDDRSCREADGCPDAGYLADRGIYATSDTELVLEQLLEAPEGDRERHRVTVVLLDSGGTRIGESAFEISFDVNRDSPS